MTNPRRMRRTARKMRRYGMQPMVVMNAGDPLPDLVIVTLARFMWRYRSELAPLTTAGLTWVAAWICHATHTAWWPIVAGTAAVLADGRHYGETPRPGHPGRTRLRHGRYRGRGWMAGRCHRGRPSACTAAARSARRRTCTRGALVGAPPAPRQGPCRTPPGCLARDRPGGRPGRIAGHVRRGGPVGLAGPLRASPAARPSPTSSPSFPPSSPGWAPSAALPASTPPRTTWPTGSSCGCWTRTRTPTRSPGPARPSRPSPNPSTSARSRTPCPPRVLLLRRHALFGGATGSGKSGGLNVLMGNLTACTDVVIWAIDLKRGMELGPWASCLGRLATTPAEARALLADAVAILEARAGIPRRHWPARLGTIPGHARADHHH